MISQRGSSRSVFLDNPCGSVSFCFGSAHNTVQLSHPIRHICDPDGPICVSAGGRNINTAIAPLEPFPYLCKLKLLSSPYIQFFPIFSSQTKYTHSKCLSRPVTTSPRASSSRTFSLQFSQAPLPSIPSITTSESIAETNKLPQLHPLG